jgi:hypothetical protein
MISETGSANLHVFLVIAMFAVLNCTKESSESGDFLWQLVPPRCFYGEDFF